MIFLEYRKESEKAESTRIRANQKKREKTSGGKRNKKESRSRSG
jgi:hypothetical protein